MNDRFDHDLRRAAAPLAQEPLSSGVLDPRLDEGAPRAGGPRLVAVLAGGVAVAIAALIGLGQLGPDTGQPSPSPSRTPAASATPLDPSPSADASIPPDATPAAATPPPSEVRPLILPAAIAARPELPFCGHETVNRQPDGDHRDAEVRACFLAAFETGDAAEMISDSPTVEGGPIREVFRLLPFGEIEWYLDSTRDPLAGQPHWTRFNCQRITVGTDDAGAPTFLPESCDAGEVIVGLDPAVESTGAEIGVLERLVTFARAPHTRSIEDIPFSADGVWLGLAGDLLVRRTPAELEDPAAWDLEADAFRGRVGPFSVLDTLADWNLGTEAPPVRELAAVVGDHPHCASPAVPPPPETAELRRLSVQPVRPAACLQWWTVDLFLGVDGSIQGITLDFWEP